MYDPDVETYYLTGEKTFVTNGPEADVFTVYANLKMKDDAGVFADALTAFLVEKTFEGLTGEQIESPFSRIEL